MKINILSELFSYLDYLEEVFLPMGSLRLLQSSSGLFLNANQCLFYPNSVSQAFFKSSY